MKRAAQKALSVFFELFDDLSAEINVTKAGYRDDLLTSTEGNIIKISSPSLTLSRKSAGKFASIINFSPDGTISNNCCS